MERGYVIATIDATLKVGERILSIYGGPASDFEIEKKADSSSLAIADRKAHEAIVTTLNDIPFPVLSEEGEHFECEIRRGWDTLWTVDPLDGTKEFIKHNGGFMVNVALAQNSMPVFDIIYVPTKKEPYFGIESVEAYKYSGIVSLEDDGVALEQLIGRSEQIPLREVHDHLIVVASRSHLSPETGSYITGLKKEHGSVELISSGDSTKICLVAENKANVYPRFVPTMEWGTAARHAIAHATGVGVYQVGKGESLRYSKENLLNPRFIIESRRGH